jgi:hypothetical protein
LRFMSCEKMAHVQMCCRHKIRNGLIRVTSRHVGLEVMDAGIGLLVGTL